MEKKYLAMLNSVRKNGGGVAIIIAAQLVDSREEGEVFCNVNTPDDGTEVDYTLFRLIDVRNNCPPA